MIHEILRMGDPRLLRVAKPVGAFGTAELAALIEDMRETMLANDGAGLAAPQIGVDLRVVMFGFESNPRYPDVAPIPFAVLINPELTVIGTEMDEGWEGCLSVPGLRGWVPRFLRLRYRGRDSFGELIDRTVEGFHARVVQHECDHLDGVLYPMRMRDMSRFGFQDALFPEGSDLPVRSRRTAGPGLEGAVEGGGAVEAQVGADNGDWLVGSGQ